MLRRLRNRKAQNTAEYAILIALVIAAAIGMQTYVKRGVQARVKDSANDFTAVSNDANNWTGITSTVATSAGSQYEVENLSRKATEEVVVDKTTEQLATGGKASREIERQTQPATGDYQQYDYPKASTP
jgi:hypothetical protein